MGCAIDIDEWSAGKGNSSTSEHECLKYFEKTGYSNDHDKPWQIVLNNTKKAILFSMSDKQQRGGGRTIATGTLTTKMACLVIEKPEALIGKRIPNNIVVSGKHKLKSQHDAYSECIRVYVD